LVFFSGDANVGTEPVGIAPRRGSKQALVVEMLSKRNGVARIDMNAPRRRIATP
jgi:hypothetical protein